MTEKLVAAFRDCVFRNVEERLVVSGPGDTVNALNLFGEQFPSAQIFDLQRVLAITGVVSAVSEQVAVVARNKRAHGHELLALSQFILIEDDFFLAVGAAFLAAVNRILLTSLGARVIEAAEPRDRDRAAPPRAAPSPPSAGRARRGDGAACSSPHRWGPRRDDIRRRKPRAP